VSNQKQRPVKFVASALALSLISSVMLASTRADAFWFFRHKDKVKAMSNREQRSVAASQVSLVPGAPPALFWKPSGDAKSAVLCLHELGLHKGVFNDLGQRLAADQIAVYAIDLRGFGGWTGKEFKHKAHVDPSMNLDKTLADTKTAVEEIHKLHPNIPVFILGEAMGGALALQAATKFPDLIEGAISSAPAGDHFNTFSNYSRVSARLLTRGPNGKFTKLGEDLLERATPKPELREAMRKDAEVRLDITPKEMMACQFFMYTTKKMARNIKETPVMIVQGQKDGETKPASAKVVYNNLATKDKKFLPVAQGDHYVFEDTKVDDDVVKTTVAWLDEHTKTNSITGKKL
jgi:alpha-beta hydrolase superfamily lysophospholipase